MKKLPSLQTVREKTTQLKGKVQETRAMQTLLKIHGLCKQYWFLTQCLLILLFRASLDLVYTLVIAPVYSYSGFTLSIDPLFYLCSWLTLVVFAPFVVRISDHRTPSSMIVTFFNYLFFIPMTSYCGCHGASITFFLIGLVYWAALLFFQLRLPVLRLRKPSLHISKSFMTVLTVCSCLFVMYISGRYTGFRLTFDIVNVYDVRAEASTYNLPTVFSYLLGMMPITLTLCLLYWLERKKWLVSVAIMVVYLFLFSIGAHKSTFFLLVLVLLCRFLYREWMLSWAPGLLYLFSIAAILENLVIKSYYLTGTFIRRLMYLTIQICENYYNFFSENPLNLFRYGIMGKLGFEELYSIRIPKIIGEFRGHPQEGANSGLLGDLFANFPVFPGVILLPLILVVCFRLLDLTSTSFRTKLTLPLCLYFAISFISTSWSTVLLSNGFLLICLLLYIYPNEEGLPHA